MKRIEISKEVLENQIAKHFLRKEIAKNLNISWSTLNKLLNQYNLTMPSYGLTKGRIHKDRDHPEIDEPWLISHWVDTPKSIKQLSEEFNLTESLLEYRIHFYNLKKPTKYSCNLNKLFDLKDPQVYYLAGLVATDGYLPKDSDSFDIELSGESELILLTNLLNYFESNSRIFNYKNKHLFTITAIGLQDFLITNFGLTKNRKTFNVTIPKYFYNENCVRAYILGCLDGDGYISKAGKKIALTTASANFVTGLINLIYQFTNINFHYYLVARENSTYPSMQLVCKKEITKFLTWLYQDPLICLERKKNIAINLTMKEGDVNEVN